MTHNEKIITPVFQKITEYKPKLKVLLDDSEEEVDTRRPADEIIRAFPWTIGVEFRRLFTHENKELTYGRLYQILKIIERITQFLSFVLLSQLLEEVVRKPSMTLPDDFVQNFKTRFSVPTLGTNVWLIQTLGKIFAANATPPFIPEMEAVISKKFAKKLEAWSPIRNEIAHYLVNLDREEIQKRCLEYQESLIDVLMDLCFLAKYPVVTIADIRINKHKRKPVIYHHSVNSHPDFAAKPRVYDKPTDSSSVLLIKSLKDAPEQFLNLSPFIVDTHTEKLNDPDTKIKMDIFLYSKWTENRIHYVGAGVGDCDLRSLSDYNRLVDEFNELFTVFGPKE